MNSWRPILVSAALAIVTLLGLAYWVTGPHEIAPWRPFGEQVHAGDKTLRPRKLLWRKLAGENVERLDHVSLPILVQASLRPGFNPRVESEAVEWPELAFTRFLAFDAGVAALLALSLLIWRKQNAPARQLALVLGLFAFSLAGFLINSQARWRGNPFDWPSWPRLGLDLAVTLAFGSCVLQLEKFFSVFPTKLEDWHVMEVLLRWRGKSRFARQEVQQRYGTGRRNLLTLARRLPVAMTGLLMLGSIAGTLPILLMPVRATAYSSEWGGAFPEKCQQAGIIFGSVTSLIALALLMVFGGIFSTGLLGKLRAGRENCTEDERRQTDWLFVGGLLAAAMLMVCSVGLIIELACKAWGIESAWYREYSGTLEILFFPAGWALILAALVGAIFIGSSFGPRPLLKRTILLTAAGLAMSFLITVVQYSFVTKLLGQFSAKLQHGMSTLVSGGLVAFTFGLFRQKIDTGIGNWLDRFMPASVIVDGKRREATVMFSDLEGYTALSVGNEAHALLVTGHLQKIATEIARSNEGRVVKTIGDAVMWVFPNATAAATAALRLPEEFNRTLTREGLPILRVNSGLHHGSVVEAPDGDIYGAAVNLAARLQGVARGGKVVASLDAVQELIAGFKVEPMGKVELKNIPVPVACFSVAMA